MTPTPQPTPRYRLSLFPLPVVLLPHAPMPLHIFEPRYQALVRDRLRGDGRFGMVYHDWDVQGPFLSEEGRVGCVAEIQEHEPLEDGRSLIVVRGVERFRIVDGIESETLYFEALVTPYRDARARAKEELVARRRESIDLFEQVAAAAARPLDELPDIAPKGDVSFLLARAVQGDPGWHQGLLELRDEFVRLERLDRVFRAALDPSS